MHCASQTLQDQISEGQRSGQTRGYIRPRGYEKGRLYLLRIHAGRRYPRIAMDSRWIGCQEDTMSILGVGLLIISERKFHAGWASYLCHSLTGPGFSEGPS